MISGSRVFCVVVVGTGFLLVSSAALATPVQWGGNGHFYERVDTPAPLTWFEARDGAAARSFMGEQGYLATVTSQAEQDALFALLGGIDALSHHYLGGVQAPDGAEPAGGWQWITGEAWIYTNWGSTGEPNDSHQFSPNGEDALTMTLGFQFNNPNAGHWNDWPLDAAVDLSGCCNSGPGYIAEFNAQEVRVPEPSSIFLAAPWFLVVLAWHCWRRRSQPVTFVTSPSEQQRVNTRHSGSVLHNSPSDSCNT